MRKLASIQVIYNIEPINGADKIELARVLGWQCVVNKGQFKKYDRAVYFEIDSFLPIDPRFEFLRASSYKQTDIMGEGFRLKTMKFRGEVSQGLLLPLSLFPEIPEDAPVGADVTTLLGVRKWEIEERVTTGGTQIGELPKCVPHTDETRIQNAPELIEAFGSREYYISTKMDGSSHSICLDDDGFHVTGHNFEYKDDGKSAFYNFVNERGFREKLEAYAKSNNFQTVTVQGEFCAPGIQKNRLRLARPEWYVFTIICDGVRLSLEAMLNICELLGAEHVPIEEIGHNFPEKYPTVEAVLSRADGEYPRGGQKEGIVVRTTTPAYSDITDSRYLSFKAVSNKYLLKTDA